VERLGDLTVRHFLVGIEQALCAKCRRWGSASTSRASTVYLSDEVLHSGSLVLVSAVTDHSMLEVERKRSD
jgi:hypothetical protein